MMRFEGVKVTRYDTKSREMNNLAREGGEACDGNTKYENPFNTSCYGNTTHTHTHTHGRERTANNSLKIYRLHVYSWIVFPAQSYDQTRGELFVTIFIRLLKCRDMSSEGTVTRAFIREIIFFCEKDNTSSVI